MMAAMEVQKMRSAVFSGFTPIERPRRIATAATSKKPTAPAAP